MKFEITRKGVHDAKGEPIEPGTEITIKGDAVPGWLVNKGRVVKPAPTGKKAMTNPAGAEPQDAPEGA